MQHVEIAFHFVHDKVAQQQLAVRYISSKDHIADIMTKALSTTRFKALRDKLNVSDGTLHLRADLF